MLCGGASASEPTRIAFVDTGNTGRSVTAEALANAIIHDKSLPIQVISRAFDLNPYNTEHRRASSISWAGRLEPFGRISGSRTIMSPTMRSGKRAGRSVRVAPPPSDNRNACSV